MILIIIQISFLIITSIHVYKTAKSNGYNAVLWTLLNVCVFLLIPVFIAIFIGLGLGLALAAGVVDASSVETLVIVTNIVTLIIGVAGVFWILKRVSRLNETEEFEAPPAPGFFNLE